MNNGWIKLHRQILENDVFRNDRTAWHIFEILLVLANKKSGTWSGGRKQLAYLSGVNENTLKDALKRLKNRKMVTQASNTKYTVITICNWKKYQSSENGVGTQVGTQTAPKRHPIDTTLTRIKNKELRNIYKSNDLVKTQSIYDFYVEKFNKNPNTYKLTDKRKTKLKVRLKDAGEELIKKAIENVANEPFYNGDNERGWKADLDFIIRSYEQVERLAHLDEKSGKKLKLEDYV